MGNAYTLLKKKPKKHQKTPQENLTTTNNQTVISICLDYTCMQLMRGAVYSLFASQPAPPVFHNLMFPSGVTTISPASSTLQAALDFQRTWEFTGCTSVLKGRQKTTAGYLCLEIIWTSGLYKDLFSM